MSSVLGVIGCGKMAYALIKGVLNKSELSISAIYACDLDKERIDLFNQEFSVFAASSSEVVKNADIIILAVKPAQILSVLSETHTYWDDKKLLISVAAGIKTSKIENILGIKVPVVRVMPNTPCLLGEGVSAITGGQYATVRDIELVQSMMESVGISLQLDEYYMDAVTAVSGSGPAYVYLAVEAMIDAAVQIGLRTDIARQLVLQTFKGSIDMLEETGKHPAELKQDVCSPGGTTIAGVRALEENGIRKSFFSAVEKAWLRSMELGKDN